MTYNRYTLGELVQIKYGKNQKNVLSEAGTYPIYGTGGLMGYATEPLYTKPSVLIGRKGTIDKVKYVDHPFWTVDTLFYTIVNEELVLPKYLYYRMSMMDLRAYNEGTTIPSLRTETLNRLEFDIPSLEDQRKILSFLEPIDEKIAVNNQINNNLAEQAVSLFRRYYDQATDEVYFTDLIQILGGGTPKTTCEAYWNGEIPFFTPKDVGSPYVLSTEKYITENGLTNCNSRLYPINTVFVTARGTVGKISMPGIPMAMNQSCYALVGKNIPQLLVYFYTLQTVAKLKHKAMGAVFDAITTRDFETEQVRRLDNAVANEFIGVVEPIYKQILSLTMENQKLVELRDAILPKLMSGDIDLSVVKT